MNHSPCDYKAPLVLFGYLAGITGKIEMTTGVLILGQRQAVLVAKQAAEVDVLTRWPPALGRQHRLEPGRVPGPGRGLPGRRSVEQIKLLRELWTNPENTLAAVP